MPTIIWHNPRCSKSRATLALLTDRGLNPTIRTYLNDSPTVSEIQAALSQLGIQAHALMRTGEAAYKEQNLHGADDPALVAAMAETPKLIQRPVVFHGGKAALGRPPEAVLSLFE